MLGLLGFMLGFSFAGAASRFVDRQDQIVFEANAIGTAYLRADMLEEPCRTQLRRSLRDYTNSRIEIFDEKNRTRLGLIQINQEPLPELQQSFQKPTAP